LASLHAQNGLCGRRQFCGLWRLSTNRGKPREIFVLHRGEVAIPGDPGGAGVSPLAGDSQGGLMQLERSGAPSGLATLLTDPEHPMVWR